MNKYKRNSILKVIGAVACLGLVGVGTAYSERVERIIPEQKEVRYAKIEFRGKFPSQDMGPYDLGYVGHVHYTLTSRLPSCQAEFDNTTTGIASLVFPAGCPENVPLEGLVSSHNQDCKPARLIPSPQSYLEQKTLLVKTSTSSDAPPVTTMFITCR